MGNDQFGIPALDSDAALAEYSRWHTNGLKLPAGILSDAGRLEAGAPIQPPSPKGPFRHHYVAPKFRNEKCFLAIFVWTFAPFAAN